MFEFSTDWDEANLATRLAEIVCGLAASSFRPYKKENGGWVLDSGNNWFLHPIERQRGALDYGRWRLSYRYGLSDRFREALEVVVERAVGPAQ
jgi:hypothetical protein